MAGPTREDGEKGREQGRAGPSTSEGDSSSHSWGLVGSIPTSSQVPLNPNFPHYDRIQHLPRAWCQRGGGKVLVLRKPLCLKSRTPRAS